MTKNFKICILLPEGNEEIEVRQSSSKKFDTTFGFNADINWDIANVKKLVDLMIESPLNYFTKFYEMLDKNRKFSSTYKQDLVNTLLAIHYESFEAQEKRLEPYLVFVSKEFDDRLNDYSDISFLQDEWFDYTGVSEKLLK